MRHAKSSWDDPSLGDFDRPLSPRGQKDAPRMGAELLRRGWLPETTLVSPAARTRETWQLVSANWPPTQSAFPESLYAAASAAILAEIRGIPKIIGTLLVIGHNPGLEELARQLAGTGSDAKSLRLLGEKFPTAAIARFAFEGRWDELQPGTTHLTDFLRPKDLA
jgi:phosphohistidine phosphatase